MKNICSLGIFLTMLLGPLNAQIIDRVIGEVGGEIILYSELESQLAYQREANQGVLTSQQECALLGSILSEKLLINQAKLDSVEVSDVEVEGQLQARIDQILSFMGNDVTQFENYYGKSVAEVKEEMRIDLKNKLLAQKMREQVAKNVQATPEEVRKYFDSMPEDSIPYFNAEVEIQEIVLKPQVSASEEDKIIAELEKLRTRIIAGESFEELAAIYSDDKASAKKGGNIGMMKRGALDPSYEAVAYNLEKDEISRPVKSSFGYHIIQLLDRRGNNFSTRHILLQADITEKNIADSRTTLDSIRSLIMTDSMRFEHAVEKFGYDKAPSYSYGGRVINPETGDTFFELGDLDPDTYFAIDSLNVNEITQPIEFQGQDGSTLIKIVKLISLSSPHKASLETDFARIQKMASAEKEMGEFNEWMKEKANNTYIKLNLREGLECKNMQIWQEYISVD